METDDSNIEIMWELSELETKLSQNPTASGYRELANRYRKLGWSAEAERLDQQAKALEPPEPPAQRASVPQLSGPCTPAVLLDLVELLHTMAASGELGVETPEHRWQLSFVQGEVHDARVPGGASGGEIFRQALRLKGGRYAFRALLEPPPRTVLEGTSDLIRQGRALVDPALSAHRRK